MKLNARSTKVSAVLDPSELTEPPGGTPRVTLQIAVGGRVVTADIAAKSVRKARATVGEHGADKVTVFLQGRLDADNTIAEAGLAAQVKLPRAEAT
jgi:hypothetical protein